MENDLEAAALDYSSARKHFDYSHYSAKDEYRPAARLQPGADQKEIDDLLESKEAVFLALLASENDPSRLKDLACRNMNTLDLRRVLVPLLERYAELCGPKVLLCLMLSTLYWTSGEDDIANRYLEMAAEIDSDNLYVLRQRLFYANDVRHQALISQRILDRYPTDPIATDTMRRIEQELTPSLSPHAGEHTSLEFVLSRLDCAGWI